MILKMFTVGPFQENCYLIGDELTMSGVLIDPGDEGVRIISEVKKSNLKLLAIWNTHAHLDHVGAVQMVKEEFGIPFYLHADDELLLKNVPRQAAMFGLASPPVPGIDSYLKAPSELCLGKLSVRVFHTPGHSPGSVCFYIESEKVVIGGDVLFNGSIGRTDLPGGNCDTLLESIKTNLFTLPDDTIVYPGHGPSTAIGFEKRNNPFFN